MGLAALENNVVCPICGKAFHLKPYRIKRAKVNYCSRECQTEARKHYMKGSGNHQYGLRGELNPTWAGGTKIENGYRMVQSIGHPFSVGRSEYVLEHRLVAEMYLLTNENSVTIDGRRYLSPNYVVHHKNKNRLDNRVENLEVMTLSEHQSLHNKETMPNRVRDSEGRFTSEVKGKNNGKTTD